MQIQVVYNPADLEALAQDWTALCEEVEESSAFATPVWYQTWWRHYAAQATLHIVTMREEGTLVAVAPLMLRRVKMHGVPAIVLGFIENNLSLNNDFIVVAGARERFLRELLRYLSSRGSWDAVVFRNFPETSENFRLLTEMLAGSGKRWLQHSTWFESPCLVPSGSWADYLASRSSRTRKTLRNIANSIHKAGEVRVRQIVSWEEFVGIRKKLFEVTRRSWAATSGDHLSSTDSEPFFNDLAAVAARKGWLSVWTLELNGEIIAIEFHLKAYGKDHAMRGHYLPEYASLSPGTYLEMEILRQTFDSLGGVRVYDFGGSFEHYKKKWTEEFVGHCDILLFGDKLYSRLIAFHESTAVPLLRRCFPPEFWNNRFFRMCGINTRRMDDG